MLFINVKTPEKDKNCASAYLHETFSISDAKSVIVTNILQIKHF